MSEISTFKLIKEKLQAIPNQRLKGSWFEKVSKRFLKEHDSADEYESIDLWSDWELRGKEDDRGIDIVITTASKEYIAVQCKFHQDSVSWSDLSTFLSKLQSGVKEIRFKKGIIISTSNLSSTVLNEIEQIRKSKGIDIVEISEEDFIYSQIDWEKFDPTQIQGELPLCDKKKPRPHQIEAIKATKEYFSNPKNTRGKLIMACGTGKTYTSLKIMEALEPKITLFLAPSIALLSQTFREYRQEKSEPFYASIVCSDDKVGKGKKNKNDDDTDDINFSELPNKPSTRPEDILSVCELAQKENKRFIIFSTYQSALRIQEAQEVGLGEIDLVICDEAHRTVGAMYSSNERDDKNAFTLCHSDEYIKAKKRLYMTATPKVYSESSKARAKESDNAICSMDDEGIFGEEIYTLNFTRAIALDLLTDYKVMILAVRKEDLSGVTNSVNQKISRLEAEGTKLDKKLINNEFVCKIIGTHKGLAKQDLIALDDENKQDHDLQNKNDTTPSQRAISFCKSINTSKNIKDSFETIMECYDEELKKKSFKNLTISIDHIDGTMNCKVRLEKLEELNAFKPNTCKVLSNARCLSEGVDVPALDSIVFFDPFTGTGSFIARLLSKENGFISDEALKEKFLNHCFAFDIVLLAYYIALINITQAAQNRDGSLKNFKNIALTDSLDFYEEKNDKGVFDLFKDLEENKEIKSTIEKQNIRVIIGNPPYSAGAKSENDNNQNLSHPKLEKRVYEKYGKNSTAKVGAITRDTLIQSIYMASELLKDKGVLGFVVNGGFIDSKSGDGFRKCVAQEFAHLYVLNLRGNARTSGETFKKEGGKIFDSGSRATIAIIFFVKDTSVKNSAIHYYDIGDYLKREEKLNRLSNFLNLDAIKFETIIPNAKGDWINQRDDAFEKLIPLKRDKKLQNNSIFDINSNGVTTGRDPWAYNFSKDALTQNVQKCIDTYNADLKRFNTHFREAFKQRTKGVKSDKLHKLLNDKEITTDKTKIAWTDDLKNHLIKNKNLQESHKDRIRLAMYRPFNKQWLYWDKDWINRQCQLKKLFPDKDAQNVVINTGVGNGKNFSALVSDFISDYGLIVPNQAYPLYCYDDLGNRHYAISGYALNLFRKHYEDHSIAYSW